MKISVITPTIRKDRLEIVEKALRKQTFEDFEWLIGSRFDPQIPWATWIEDDFEGGFWSLNRIYNKLIANAKGDLIVSWQDSIYAPPGALDAFWADFMATNGHGIISAVGDQYGKLDNFGKPYNKVWSDPRKRTDFGTFYQTSPENIEWNLCVVPRKTLLEIGGFDEQMDFLGYGLDGYQVNERLDAQEYEFYLDQTIESYTLRHDRSDFGGQEEWDKNNMMQEKRYEKRRHELMQIGQWPIIENQLLTTS